MSECVLVRFLDLTAPSDPESEIFSLSSSVSQLNVVVSQTFSSSENRGASCTLLCEQSQRARMNVGGLLVKAVPEAVRNRPSPQSAPYKAVPECVRNRAPPPEGTPLQLRPT